MKGIEEEENEVYTGPPATVNMEARAKRAPPPSIWTVGKNGRRIIHRMIIYRMIIQDELQPVKLVMSRDYIDSNTNTKSLEVYKPIQIKPTRRTPAVNMDRR